MGDPIKPVGKLTPIGQVSSPSQKPVGKLTPIQTFDYNSELEHQRTVENVNEASYDKKLQEIDKLPEFGAMEIAKSALAPSSMANELYYSKGEKERLKELYMKDVDEDTFNRAKVVMGSGVNYYFDDNGLPVPLKSGQKPPDGKSVASIWGTQSEAEDDGLITTAAKNIYSAIPGIVNNIGDLAHLPYGLITGKEADWYTDLKNSTEAIKFKTSTASQAPIFNSEGVDSWDDLFDSKRFNVNADNVVGTASQLVGTVLEFMAGGAGAKAIGIGGKAISALASAEAGTASLATKLAAKTPYFVGGYMTNLGEALDAADEAGVKGRDKYAVASLVTIPVSAIEMIGGLEAKMMNSALAQKEKSQMVKSLIKGWAETNGKEVSQKTLKELYEATNVATTSLTAKLGKEFIETGVGEATEEVLQNMTQKASQQIYDHLFAEGKEEGKGRYGTEVLSPESVGEYFNDAIGGLLGGAGGNIINAKSDIRKAKAELQSEQAYGRIANGKAEDLKLEVQAAHKAGLINDTELNTAMHKIGKYQEYHDAIKGLDLNDEEKRRVSDLNWTGENLKMQMEQLSKNPKAKDETSLEYKQLSVLQKIYKAATKEIEETMTKPLADQQLSTPVAIQKDIENKAETTPAAVKTGGFKIKSVAKEGNETTNESLINQIKNASSEKDIDAYVAEADKKGLNSPDLMDASILRKQKIQAEIKQAKKTEKLKDIDTTEKQLKSEVDYLSNEIESLSKVSKEYKNKISFEDIDLSDESDFVKAERLKDKAFNDRLKINDNIQSSKQTELKVATEGQSEAINNLIETGMLEKEHANPESMASASSSITQGVRRIQYALSTTTDEKEKEQLKALSSAITKIQKFANEKGVKAERLKKFSELRPKDSDTNEIAKEKSKGVKAEIDSLSKKVFGLELEKKNAKNKLKADKIDVKIKNIKAEIRDLTDLDKTYEEHFDLKEEVVMDNKSNEAGYSTIALDYLLSGGLNTIGSTDYFLQALVAAFEKSSKEINSIRNKYANQLGNLKEDIGSEAYIKMMQEISDVLNKKYKNTNAIDLFNEISKYPTGLPTRKGNEISIKLDELNKEKASTPKEKTTKAKIKAKKDISIEMSDDVKDTPMFRSDVKELLEEYKPEEIKEGKIAPGANDSYVVEVDNKRINLASAERVKSKLKKLDLGSLVKLKVVKAGEVDNTGKVWDPEAINKKQGTSFGDKIEVWGTDKNGNDYFIDNLRDTDERTLKKKAKKEAEKKAAEEIEAKKKTDSEIKKAIVEEKNNYSDMSDKQITKLDAFQELKKKNPKWSDKRVIEYFKKCK